MAKDLAKIITVCKAPEHTGTFFVENGISTGSQLALWGTKDEDAASSKILPLYRVFHKKKHTTEPNAGQEADVLMVYIRARQLLDSGDGMYGEPDDNELDTNTSVHVRSQWDTKHNFKLKSRHLLSDVVLKGIHKQLQHTPVQFKIVHLEELRMANSFSKKEVMHMDSQSSESKKDHVVYEPVHGFEGFKQRVHALFHSYALVGIDNPTWFSYQNCRDVCEHITDLTNLRYGPHHVRPPLEYFQKAYLKTMERWSDLIRNQAKTLADCTDDHAMWEKFWTDFQPGSGKGAGKDAMDGAVPELHPVIQKQFNMLKAAAAKANKGKGKGKGKGGKDGGKSHKGEWKKPYTDKWDKWAHPNGGYNKSNKKANFRKKW